MKQIPLILSLLFVFLLTLTACQPITRNGQPQAETISSPPTAAPLQITLQPRSGDASRSAGEVFTNISPAVAFVETPNATGSGVLIDHNYLLSNAHVVWPFDKVRVVFPDGSEHKDVSVYAWDLMADLALIGPIETDIAPISLVDAGEVEIGSDVYLIGYPAEIDEFPQPTMTSGILSRVRTWESLNYSFFQVDATTIGGQSGGVLVTQQGDVVGISTFYYRSFGLAGNVATAIDRINALLGNDTGVTLDDRGFAVGEPATEYSDTLLNQEDVRRYILQEAPETEVTINVAGVGRPQISVQSLSGYSLERTEPEEDGNKAAELTFTVEDEGPHLVVISQPSENENSFELTSSHPLLPYSDPDDRQKLTIGNTLIAHVDVPGDTDSYELDLKADDLVEITVDALVVDPSITLRYASETLEEEVWDSDSGGGIFGQNAKIVYKAPEDGTYTLLLKSYDYEENIGGYFLTVNKAPADAEITEVSHSRQLIPTNFGKMVWYDNEESAFTMLYPVEWEKMAAGCPSGITACFGSPAGLLMFAEESLRALPKKERNRAGYLSLINDLLAANPNVELTSNEPISLLQKLPADKLTFSLQKGRGKGLRVIYVDEEESIAYSLSYLATTDIFDRSEELLEYIFDSFRVWKTEERDGVAAHHMDQAVGLAATKKYKEAIASLTKAIELDPTLYQAHLRRAMAYYREEQYEATMADMSTALALRPEDDSLYHTRAMLRWMEEEFAEALNDVDAAIDLNPEKAEFYNFRALINASLKNYAEALADLEEYEKVFDDELPPNVLDTRGYIYLLMGEYEKAREDFDAILDKDLRFAYALLGAGIAYAHTGDEAAGQALIEEAMEKFGEESLEKPSPQLTNLLALKEELAAK